MLIDLNMVVATGGRKRTEAAYGDLLSEAGMRLKRILATGSPFSVIEDVP